MSFALEITNDTATGALNAIPAKVSPRRLSAAVGPALTVLIQDNFVSLGQNQRGWPSTHFWGRAAKATSWAQAPGGTLISINMIGVRQRYLGGPIRPVNTKALAFPIDEESYGKLPSEFPDLFMVVTKKGAYLCEKTSAVKGSLKGGLKFLFKLSFGVNQKPDAKVLPTREEMAETVKEAMIAAIRN